LTIDDELSEPWAFLRWGTTADNVTAYFFRKENRTTITLAF